MLITKLFFLYVHNNLHIKSNCDNENEVQLGIVT